jgi:Arc/MetJ family transcription regulator
MRTTIDLDDDQLAAAQRELGTTTMKDTVNAALAYVATRGQRTARQVNNAFDFWGGDVGDPDTMRGARR